MEDVSDDLKGLNLDQNHLVCSVYYFIVFWLEYDDDFMYTDSVQCCNFQHTCLVLNQTFIFRFNFAFSYYPWMHILLILTLSIDRHLENRNQFKITRCC